MPYRNFLSENYHFLFLFLLDPEPFETCTNTIKRFNSCVLPSLGVIKDWLSIWHTPYKSASFTPTAAREGLRLNGIHHQKLPPFFDVTPNQGGNSGINPRGNSNTVDQGLLGTLSSVNNFNRQDPVLINEKGLFVNLKKINITIFTEIMGQNSEFLFTSHRGRASFFCLIFLRSELKFSDSRSII